MSLNIDGTLGVRYGSAPPTQTRPYDFGTDAIERQRVSLGQAMMDADFEYGLQSTKWQSYVDIRKFPSFFEIPGTDYTFSNIVSDGASPNSNITIYYSNVVQGSNQAIPTVGSFISVFSLTPTRTALADRAEGYFIVSSSNTGGAPGSSTLYSNTANYVAKSWVPAGNIQSNFTFSRRANVYNSSTCVVPSPTIFSDGSSNLQVFTSNAHGLLPGMPLTANCSAAGSQGGSNLIGTVYVTSLTSANSFNIVANALTFGPSGGAGSNYTNLTSNTTLYISQFGSQQHRPYDGGVLLSTLSPCHGATVIRQSKKAFRYQSGKGILFSSGTLFCPQLDISSINTYGITQATTGGPYNTSTQPLSLLVASSTGFAVGQIVASYLCPDLGTVTVNSVPDSTHVNINWTNTSQQANIPIGTLITVLPPGSNIQIVTDVIHGIPQPGATAVIRNFTTTQFNGTYTISGVIDSRTVNVQSQTTLTSTLYNLGDQPRLVIAGWHGSSVRAGCFEDPNGLFWEYDGQTLAVVRRQSTFQTAGYVMTSPQSQILMGTTVQGVSGTISGQTYTFALNTPLNGYASGQTLTFSGATPPNGTITLSSITATTFSVAWTGGVTASLAAGTTITNATTGTIVILASTVSGTTPRTITVRDVAASFVVGDAITVPGSITGTVISTSNSPRQIIINVTGPVSPPASVASGTLVTDSTTAAAFTTSSISTYTGNMTLTAISAGDTQTVITLASTGSHTVQQSMQTTIPGLGQVWVVGAVDFYQITIGFLPPISSVTLTTAALNTPLQWTLPTTRFQDQLKVNDRFTVRGMVHQVTSIQGQGVLTFNPPYRGTTTITSATPVKCCKIKELRVPQVQFNRDTIDGRGPSGYKVDLTRQQMIGIQYTWYGAGFVDFMIRGPDGNWIMCHRIKNNNVNDEAYMRSGNLPVRYELSVESRGAMTSLYSNLNTTSTIIPVNDPPTYFPSSNGTLLIDNELISYTSTNINCFLGCTRAATLNYVVSDTSRTFTGQFTGPNSGTTHLANTSVNLISCTATPTITHWGSSFLTDGGFDSERGYYFNYSNVNVTWQANAPVNTGFNAFAVRLAPSVTNGLVGDIGAKELLNRAQLLLQKLEATSPFNMQVIGFLNPTGVVFNPANWVNINNTTNGSQPSFAQYYPGNLISGTPQPGERIFQTIVQQANQNNLDLSGIKELTNGCIGGNQCFPDGPDVLLIYCTNLNAISSTVQVAQINLFWTEAQA